MVLGYWKAYLNCVLVLLAAQRANAQVTYTLKPTPKTVAWGYYDAKTLMVVRLRS